MTASELKHQASLEKWRQNILECRGSGLRVKEWCITNGVTPSTYYRWERELFGNVRTKTEPVALEPSFAKLSAPVAQQACLPAQILASVHLGSIVVDIYTGTDPQEVRALCEALRLC